MIILIRFLIPPWDLGNHAIKGKKDTEITVVQELLQAVELKGVTFTLDALHCQKKQQPSLLKIRMIGNRRKKESPLLYAAIEATMAGSNKSNSWCTEIEINKGRTELRTITVSNDLEGISDKWIGVKQIVSI